MFKPSPEIFNSLCQQGNLIPVYREHLADMETPVSAFSRFAEDDYAFLLESVEGGEHWGRYSFIGIHPRAVFEVTGGKPVLCHGGSEFEVLESENGSAFEALRSVLASRRLVTVPELPRFVSGAVGFLSYETSAEFEKMPFSNDALSSPSACFLLTEEMAIFDNVRHTVTVLACARPDEFESPEAAYEDACRRIEAIEKRLRDQCRTEPLQSNEGGVQMQSNLSKEDYTDMVRRAKSYIMRGDIIQAVLSQRFTGISPADTMTLYRALRLINPSPYMFFLKMPDRTLVGSSPEVMVRLTGNRAELRPIAGTRPRGQTEQEDRQLADSLLSDEKERAEHVMLVDLGRNDLGRIAVSGSVQVRDFMHVERYSHVMHIVSNIEAHLKDEHDAFDLIRATFPAGTLSGAPKIRAMEIIHELEKEPRGAYGGAVGYIGYDGNMDLAITIRTMEMVKDLVSVQAGAGIVADSDPEREYEETLHKAQGMVRAMELAARGLEL